MTREQLREEQQATTQRTRVAFIPREFKGQIRTFDGSTYRRLPGGQIVRAHPKVRGKAARKADKRARRQGDQR